jgi:Na+-driven multidrug efflux pump
LVAVVLLIAALWYGRHGVSIRRAGTWWPQVRVARDLLMIGIPAAVEEVLIISAFASLTPIIAGLGTISLAAHRVVLNILSLSFLPGIGFGLAATALVGQSVGARRPAEAEILTRMALRWAIYWMGGLGLIFIPLAAPLIQLFSNDPQMVTAGVGALQITALMQPLWATGMVFAGALRGTGDTRTPLLITGISMWTGVGLGAIGMHLLPPSLTVIWGAFIITGPFEVLCFWLAWRAWRRKHAAVSLPITINSDITAQG